MIPVSLKPTAPIDVRGVVRAFLERRLGAAEALRHNEAVDRFQHLRENAAAAVAANEGSRDALLQYYAQIVIVRNKMPTLDVGAERVSFSWGDSLQPRRAVPAQPSWAYEAASVLFNFGAIESHLACNQSRDTKEGIEAAGRRFCSSAGVFAHLKNEVAARLLGAIPVDLTAEGLEMLTQLQLAQGQACYYEMARKRDMKAEVCARLAGQAADYYRAALASLPPSKWADLDADFPYSLWLRMYMTVFDAASFWQMSQKALADANATGDGYGAEVAWLRVAENAANAAIQVVRSSSLANAATVSLATATSLLSMVTRRKADAERDNASIYLQSVPDPHSLPIIPRAVMAKPAPLPDLGPYSSRDVFQALVPPEIHEAISSLDEKLALIVADAKARADAVIESVRSSATGLGLPGLTDTGVGNNPGTGGLPAPVWERVRATQAAGGVSALDALATANAKAGAAARSLLGYARAALDEEAAADARARAEHGPRWSVASSTVVAAEPRAELTKLERVAASAGSSDAVVAAKLREWRNRLEVLSRTRAELDASVPALPGNGAGNAGPAVEAQRAAVSAAYRQLTAAIDALPAAAVAIGAAIDRATSSTALLAAQTADHAATVDALVSGEAVTRAKAAFEAKLAAVPQLLATLTAHVTRFRDLRLADAGVREREAAVQAVAEAVERFDEIHSHLREGAEFYAALNGHAAALRTTATDLAAARAMQAREHALDLSTTTQGMVDVDAGLSSLSNRQLSLGGAVPRASSIPASVYASANSPAGGWVLPAAVPVHPAPQQTQYYTAPAMVSPPTAPQQLQYSQQQPQQSQPPPPSYLLQQHMPQYAQAAEASYAAPGSNNHQQPSQQPQQWPRTDYISPQVAAVPNFSANAQGNYAGSLSHVQPSAPPSSFQVPPPTLFRGGGMSSFPYPGQLAQLTSMGFERLAAESALINANGDIDTALQALLA